MGKEYFTIQELQSMKLYELPTRIYEEIIEELERVIIGGRKFPPRFREIVDRALISDLDQYIDIYKFIKVI